MAVKDLKTGMLIEGIEPDTAVKIVSAEAMGKDNLKVIYTSESTGPREQLIARAQLAGFTEKTSRAGWAFTADSQDFKLAMEAQRINLAYYFDPMMAIHSSNVDPLPHQISAVYEHMLPKIPLRFVLADDPGAGKTIMTGLLISELLMRADIHRVLIITPGSLTEQWEGELREKFGLRFTRFSPQMQEESEIQDRLIARLDQLSRDEDIQKKLLKDEWDLIVVDEAHKMSARQSGRNVKKTKRFQLGEKLRDKTRHLLLLTATPHNGVERDFNNFMSLLDSERFYPSARGKTRKADIADVMRRVVKEELIKFDGAKLFPERRSQTVKYELSEDEMALYQAVTDYVRREMNRVDKLSDRSRRGSVGLAMTALQRRLASSPLAIYQSLVRRHDKLKKRIEEMRAEREHSPAGRLLFDDDFDDDDLTDEEYREREEKIIDRATAAQTIKELQQEVSALDKLKAEAKRLKDSRADRKWEQLSALLQQPVMRTNAGEQKKLIIFTEHRDTLSYLQDRITGLLGNQDAVLTIHGGLDRDKRRHNQNLFWQDKNARILLATDAAGEGVNLQVASMMINYDLPWNPNRLEQRFGRIHRIGQTSRCHLWNIVADKTREGEVFLRLLEKIEREKQDLGDRVYDIIGEIFEEKPLHKLLWDAIRENPPLAGGENKTLAAVDSLFDRERLREIAGRDALCEQTITPEQLFALRKDVERAQARKLQPHFVAAFFKTAFEQLSGIMKPRETGRWEIRNVPANIRQYDREIRRRNIRYTASVLSAYERICFDKQYITIQGRPSARPAVNLHPAHPLMQSVIELIIANNREALAQGAVLIDESGAGKPPRVIFAIEHRINEEDNTRQASVEFQFVSVNSRGEYALEGWAPYLDYRPPAGEEEEARGRELSRQAWVISAANDGIVGYAADKLAAPHYERVRDRRLKMVEKERQAVHGRLQKVIRQENASLQRAVEELQKGSGIKATVDNIRRRIEDLEQRRKNRMAELSRKKNLLQQAPRIVSAMLIIPAVPAEAAAIDSDIAARRRVEQAAMQAVIAAEKSLGHEVHDVSAENCGWDITAIPAAADGVLPPSRHIEVKGRQAGSETITVSYNEILSALNQGDSYWLAIALVDDGKTDLHYIRRPFAKEPDGAATSVNYCIADMLKRAVSPQQSISGL